MRASEYYAQQIHGFFVGFGLDAIEESRHAEVATAARPAADRPDAGTDDDSAFAECTGCSCAVYAPCHHCENGHEGDGRDDAQDDEWIADAEKGLRA
jgi:hypothetical protein